MPPDEPSSPKPLGATDVLPELLPELPPEGGVVVVPGLVSLSSAGGVDGIDGATSGTVCAGGGVLPVPPALCQPHLPHRDYRQ